MQEKGRKISPIKQRILQYAETLGISKRDFYAKIGVSRGTLESNTGITEDVLAKFIATFPDISLDWLITGNGSMIADQDMKPSEIDVKETFSLRTDRNVDHQVVPLYSVEATAGVIATMDDTKVAPIDYLSLPDLPSVDGAVYVRGDSMYPLFKSGDIVLFKRVNDFQYGIFWGEVYIVSAFVDEDVYVAIKYVEKSDKEGFIRLVSLNDHHQSQDLPLERVQSLALVKASIRYHTIR